VVPPTEPCALRSTQPLKLSTRDFSWDKGGRCVWLTTYHPRSAETSGKSGALILPGTPWATSACRGRPLLYFIITTGFVEIVPVIPRPSLSSFLRIIRALIFFVIVNRMNMNVNMNETLVETCRMASVCGLLTKHQVLQPCIRNAIRQHLYAGTHASRLRVPYCSITCVPL